jgi:hypothetical protein
MGSQQPPSSNNRTSVIDRMQNQSYTNEYDINDTCVITTFVMCNDTTFPKPTITKTKFGIAWLRLRPWLPLQDFFNFSSCQYSNCYFEEDVIRKSTRMVIVEIYVMSDEFKPVKRWPHQLYVASIWESPNYTSRSFLTSKFLFSLANVQSMSSNNIG